MKFCYVVTIGDKDNFYADLGYISVTALRRVHPDDHVVLLMDEVTAPILEKMNHPMLAKCQEIKVVQTGMATPMQRSRFVKTAMRGLVDGDFLYLDVDAIPIRSLAEIETFDCDLGVTNDCNFPLDDNQTPPEVLELYKKLGWGHMPQGYINGGVLFFRDTPKARELGAMWHERWLQTHALGCDKDQPSLNSSLHAVNPKLHLMPTRYNAMVGNESGIEHVYKAAMLHFWVAIFDHNSPRFILHPIYERFKETGQIDPVLFDRMVRQGYAWTDPYWVAARWQCGHYGWAFIAACVKGSRKIKAALGLRKSN